MRQLTRIKRRPFSSLPHELHLAINRSWYVRFFHIRERQEASTDTLGLQVAYIQWANPFMDRFILAQALLLPTYHKERSGRLSNRSCTGILVDWACGSQNRCIIFINTTDKPQGSAKMSDRRSNFNPRSMEDDNEKKMGFHINCISEQLRSHVP